MDLNEIVLGIVYSNIEPLKKEIVELRQKVDELISSNCNTNLLDIVSRKQVAEMLGVNPNKVTEFVKKGKLKCFNHHKNCKMMFYKNEIEAFLKTLD
jgi:hypothetical protein